MIQHSPQLHPRTVSVSSASSSHQHLATFGANHSTGSGISGSGSDQNSEGKYSNRSGDGCSSASSNGKLAGNRSRSDSEKSNETMQSQVILL